MEILGIILYILFIIIVLVFSIWLHVRILHKAGYSGWWYLLLLIPIVGIIMLWVFAFADWPALNKPTSTQQPPANNPV